MAEKQRRWRYVMEGEIAADSPMAEPRRLEGYVRTFVSWNDVVLPHLRGAHLEVETEPGSNAFRKSTDFLITPGGM